MKPVRALKLVKDAEPESPEPEHWSVPVALWIGVAFGAVIWGFAGIGILSLLR